MIGTPIGGVVYVAVACFNSFLVVSLGRLRVTWGWS